MPLVTITKCFCDSCGKEIPINTKTDSFGIKHTIIETGKINCPPMYKTMDMSKFGIYHCELCAEKINHRLDIIKYKCIKE